MNSDLWLKADEMDVTEVSYNDGKLMKNDKDLGGEELTSDCSYGLENKSEKKDTVVLHHNVNDNENENESFIVKVKLESPTNSISLNSENVKLQSEESLGDKCLKKNIKSEFLVNDTKVNNDNSAILKHPCNTKPVSCVKLIPIQVTTSENIVSLLHSQPEQKVLKIEQPTLEHTNIKQEEEENGIFTSIPKIIKDLMYNNCTFEIEQQYNKLRCMHEPYCAICVIFNYIKFNFNSDWQNKVPSNVTVFPTISKAYFKNALYGNGNTTITDLIRCENCFLIVHKICYDVSANHNVPWLCERCETKSFDAICEYCPLKGGALQKLYKNIWAHPECDFFVRGTSIPSNHNFSTNFLTIQRCTICNLTYGNYFRCSTGSCDSWFHIRCGILAGFKYKIEIQSKQNIFIQCSKHYNEPIKQKFGLDDIVYVRSLTSDKAFECRILKVEKIPVCIVKHNDGSVSYNVELKNIKNYTKNSSLELFINKKVELVNGEDVLFLDFYNTPLYTVVDNKQISRNVFSDQILGNMEYIIHQFNN